MRFVLLASLAIGCNYHASFGDCEITCTQATGCPDGFSCNSEGKCRADGVSATCNQVLDAPRDEPGGDDTGGGDDMPAGSMVLRQTADDIIAAGHFRACMQVEDNDTFENSWYRVFPVTTGFHIAKAKFGIELSTAATDVRVNLGTYSGTIGQFLDRSKITTIDTAVVTLPQISVGAILDAPVSGDVAAGQNIIVEVFAPDYTVSHQTVALGTTKGAETTPGYWRAPICEVPEPKTGNRDGNPNPAFIIEVVGTAN
jgi:hypothetical protein